MARTVQQALTIMRTAIGRRNQNDPDSNDSTLISYLNDFVALIMPNDTKLFESFGTLIFTIDQDTSTSLTVVNGTITLAQACAQAGQKFINLSAEAYISLLDPVNNSISWNRLPVYQDPGEFYDIWGINNEQILIPGYPTGVLYYGDELVFRTIPNVSYQIRMYGYKQNADFLPTDVDIEFDYWLRYIAYGAAVNYARDYRYEGTSRQMIEATFKSERKQMLTHAHNQLKMSRCMPRF